MRTTLYFSVSVQLEQTRLHLNHSEKAFDSYLEYFYSLPPIAKIINLQPKIYICKMLICNNEPILPGNCIKIYTVIKKVIHFEFDPSLVFVRIFRKILTGVCLLSGFSKKSFPLSACLFGRTRTRQKCPDFRCPCPPTPGAIFEFQSLKTTIDVQFMSFCMLLTYNVCQALRYGQTFLKFSCVGKNKVDVGVLLYL